MTVKYSKAMLPNGYDLIVFMRCYCKVCTVDVASFKNIKHAIVAPPIGNGIYQYHTQRLQNQNPLTTK